LTQGAHTINAAYSGDPNFGRSTSQPLSQVVNANTTTTTLVSSQNPSIFGQVVTFTATVKATSSTLTPTGTVQFAIDGVNFGSPVPLSGGAAVVTTSLAAGTHSVAATYSGDTNFGGSTSPMLSQIVNQGVSTTSLALSSGTNPSVCGQALVFTASVKGQFGRTTDWNRGIPGWQHDPRVSPAKLRYG
jgi:Big-like domain-containing protein